MCYLKNKHNKHGNINTAKTRPLFCYIVIYSIKYILDILFMLLLLLLLL